MYLFHLDTMAFLKQQCLFNLCVYIFLQLYEVTKLFYSQNFKVLIFGKKFMRKLKDIDAINRMATFYFADHL